MSQILVKIEVVDSREYSPEEDAFFPLDVPAYWVEAYRLLSGIYEHGVFFNEVTNNLETLGFSEKFIQSIISNLETKSPNLVTAFEVRPSLYYALQLSISPSVPGLVVLTIYDPSNQIVYRESRDVNIPFHETHKAVNNALTKALSSVVISSAVHYIKNANEQTNTENLNVVKDIISDTSMTLVEHISSVDSVKDSLQEIVRSNRTVQEKINEITKEVRTSFQGVFGALDNAISKLDDMLNSIKRAKQSSSQIQNSPSHSYQQSVEQTFVPPVLTTVSDGEISKVAESSKRLADSIDVAGESIERLAEKSSELRINFRTSVVAKSYKKAVNQHVETVKKEIQSNIKRSIVENLNKDNEFEAKLNAIRNNIEILNKKLDERKQRYQQVSKMRSRIDEAISNFKGALDKISRSAVVERLSFVKDKVEAIKDYIQTIVSKAAEETRKLMNVIVKGEKDRSKDRDIDMGGPDI